MKEIYLLRHSEVLKSTNMNNTDSLQVQNEKWCLTVEGEKLAEEKSRREGFTDFDVVISSNYVRAILTAKYFTDGEVLVDESFNERKFGIDRWEDLPTNFQKKQFTDFNYKLENGESLNEVIHRQYDSLLRILDMHPNKKVLIVGHSTAFASLLSIWCDIDDTGYKFKGNYFFDGKWNYCETFKLTFDDNNNLIDIKNIK